MCLDKETSGDGLYAFWDHGWFFFLFLFFPLPSFSSFFFYAVIVSLNIRCFWQLVVDKKAWNAANIFWQCLYLCVTTLLFCFISTIELEFVFAKTSKRSKMEDTDNPIGILAIVNLLLEKDKEEVELE